MSRHHFVAIGGTGQHVALAYADIAVLSEWFGPRHPTTFWLLDADASAGTKGKSAWDELLAQTAFLRRSTDQGTLQWPDPRLNHTKPFLDVENKSSFGELLDAQLGPVFFGEQQVRVSYANGYYGHASVAATVFGEILRDLGGASVDGAASGVGPVEESDAMVAREARRARHGANASRITSLLTSPTSDQDARIVIAGSAVGGTGSGCVPRLVEEISRAVDKDRKPLALLYLPWFKLDGSPQAPRRNQDMSARMASGLLYYRDRLSKHAAAVLVGHPNIEGANRTRPWHGDDKQPAHEDLTLPIYGAAVAAQYFESTRSSTPGLFSIACPEIGGPGNVKRALHLAPSVPVRPVPEGDVAAFTIGSLWERNVEWLRRALWVLAYLDDEPGAGVPRLDGALDIPELAAASRAWLPELASWAEAKWRALRRIGVAFEGGDALPGGPTFPYDATYDPDVLRTAMPITGGIPEIRGWLGGESPATLEALCERLAAPLPPESVRLVDKQHSSTARLLPPRVGSATTQTQPVSAIVGTIAGLEQGEAQAIIQGEQVTPYAVPNARAREFVLRAIFTGSILRGLRLKDVVDKSVRTDAEELLARWVSLLTGVASGIVQVPGPVRAPKGEYPLDLIEQVKGALPECPWDQARELVWPAPDGTKVVVGYTSRSTVVVPAALTEARWREFMSILDPVKRDEARDTVRAWGRFLDRLGRPGPRPGWVSMLATWADGLGHRVFGMSHGIHVEWPGHEAAEVMLPVHGGRADARWARVIESVGRTIVNAPPMGDAQAQELHEVLVACPVFTYHPADRDGAERRRALWTVSNVPESYRKAGQLLQERYYVSESTPEVWDVLAANPEPIEIVGNEILLPEVGYIQEDDDRRYPDVPVDECYADLIDLDGTTAGAPQGNSITYTVSLRGLSGSRTHTANVRGDLAVRAGCLLWPNFASPGWRQRYAWVRTLEKQAMVLRVFGRTGQGRIEGAVRTKPEPNSPYPMGLPHLPDHAHVPALLALRRAGDGRSGLYRLDVPIVPRTAQPEAWGVDFGTTASVIAVGTGAVVHDAPLLRPEGRLDATLKVVLGRDVPLRITQWFPSWDGMQPREGATGLLPSRMVFKNKEDTTRPEFVARPASFGTGWMLDHGGELDTTLPAECVKENFKWSEDASPYRRAYLLRLLEQAVAWRARLSSPPSLPSTVSLVVTLPMRMSGMAESFEEDIKSALQHLQTFTGTTFVPRFQWESLAGATPRTARQPNRVYAALDLGGGSLDLWGAFHAGDWQVRADSLLLGGRDFLRLARIENANDAFRTMTAGQHVWDLEVFRGTGPTQARFFDLVLEVGARWVAALAADARRAGVQYDQVELGLLGRAWALGGSDWTNVDAVIGKIQSRAKALGFTGKVVANALIPTGQESRKAYLARFVATFPADTLATLEGVGASLPSTYAGIPIFTARGRKLTWSQRLQVELEPGEQLSVDRAAEPKWTPKDLDDRLAPALTSVDSALNIPGEDALRTEAFLKRSPFHNLIERLVGG